MACEYLKKSLAYIVGRKLYTKVTVLKHDDV